MPHVDASLRRGKAVPARRTTRDFSTIRQLRCGAALALCALIAACSDAADENDPLNETMGSTATVHTTGTATTSNAVSSNTVTTTSVGSVNSTTSGASTTGGLGMTTVSSSSASTSGVSSSGFGGSTSGSSSSSMGPTTSSSSGGGASSTDSVTNETSSSSASTTGGSGTCEPSGIAGSEVLMIGESFIAFSHGITHTIEDLARAAGALGANESYRDNSISGTTLAGGGNSIPNQYQNGVDQGPVKVVLMDGGGNDCLQANNPSGALSAAEALFQNMQTNGTEQVVYFFYPDPIGGNFSSLKSCLDTLRPQMKALCDGLTSPKCYWLDLREVWDGHPEYTMDGIHPTPAGDQATGEAIWEVMVENCVAQ